MRVIALFVILSVLLGCSALRPGQLKPEVWEEPVINLDEVWDEIEPALIKMGYTLQEVKSMKPTENTLAVRKEPVQKLDWFDFLSRDEKPILCRVLVGVEFNDSSGVVMGYITIRIFGWFDIRLIDPKNGLYKIFPKRNIFVMRNEILDATLKPAEFDKHESIIDKLFEVYGGKDLQKVKNKVKTQFKTELEELRDNIFEEYLSRGGVYGDT